VLEAALHPRWLAATLLTHGMPKFKNVIDFVPRDHQGFFESAFWIREHQPTSMSWDTVDKIRQRWKKPFILKGILSIDDVRRSIDAGIDAIVLSSHGGRQLDGTVSPLDLLPAAREMGDGKIELYVSGGLRRGTDLVKAVALGACAVLAGRAPLYGVCAAGAAGAKRALDIIAKEALDAMGLLGAKSVSELGPQLLFPRGRKDPPMSQAIATRTQSRVGGSAGEGSASAKRSDGCRDSKHRQHSGLAPRQPEPMFITDVRKGEPP
jgi:(S)-mandelate dehydrogenase